jgi:Cof subfamily protein (haloacid dehalogenase superfamily)
MIKCSKTGNIYYERNIDKDISRSIISELQCSGMAVSIYVDDDIYTAKNSRNIRLHRQIDNASNPDEVEDLLSLYSKPIIKILFAGSPNRLETTAEHLYHKYNESVNFYFSIPYFVEIVDKRSNKALALKFLSEHFNIDREDIIAIGDNYNDLDMIRYAGLGVAMGNAPDYLKNAANYVTHSNNSDGVAHVLQKFILNENIYA